MKIHIKLALLLVTLFFSVMSFALPVGNYRHTCKDCSMNEGRLMCRCQTANQQWADTILHHARRCDYVQNINGQLRCTSGASDKLPAGNYKKTCEQCEFNGMKLHCKCYNENQVLRHSVLYTAGDCKYRISNHNGHLVCGERDFSALPEGSYKKTCHHCHYNGYRLACTCLTRQQFPNYTVIHDAANCGFIKNINGFLECKD